MKSKYDFIIELLETQKMNSSQKERFLKGVVNELNKDFTDKDEIKNRLKKIEEKVNNKETKNSPEENNEDENENNIFPEIYYKPADLYSYLNSYNNDEILKGTCHLIDRGELDTINSICQRSEYDFEIHYKKILERFEILNSNFKKKYVDKKLKSLIHVYLNGGGDWNKNISINWISQELHNWANKNPGIPPNLDSSLFQEYESIGFEFRKFEPTYYFLLEEHNISTFGKLTQYFKYLFHIRSENSILKICKNINEKNQWNEIIEFDYTNIDERIELFTNVE
ncbi:MAG TPA: hypothetical protein PLW77_02455, partial [Bacteroidales bacterium]|nr:hypothetical protein [Bacteroidales bacterium]